MNAVTEMILTKKFSYCQFEILRLSYWKLIDLLLCSELIEMCGNAVTAFDSHSVVSGAANLLMAQLSTLGGDAS